MKKHFWFIGLFGIWGLLSAWWYFISVKGVDTTPSMFNPHESLFAIIEILVMLLVACLLGYGIAWWLQNETIEADVEKIDKLNAEKIFLVESHDDLRNQLEYWRGKHKQDLAATLAKAAKLVAENEGLKKEVIELRASGASWQKENELERTKIQLLESEASTQRYRIRQLEFQLKENDETILCLKTNLKDTLARSEENSVSDRPFVQPMEPEIKDDLTEIKGVGPFIEKRLNMIGIYTFQQLAALSPELIDRVGTAIEFFPHRITRDDWVGQAKRLARP